MNLKLASATGGTIVSLEGSTLTVKTREGPNAALALKPGWKVTGVAKASAEDIKAGDFVTDPNRARFVDPVTVIRPYE